MSLHRKEASFSSPPSLPPSCVETKPPLYLSIDAPRLFPAKKNGRSGELTAKNDIVEGGLGGQPDKYSSTSLT